MEKDNEKSADSLKRMDIKAFRLGVAAIVGILGLPYLVTQCSFGYYLGVEDANEIGDTLGGILGPFIGLISAFLVYLALREQIKANINIQDQFKREEINKSEDFYFSMFMDKIEIINKLISEHEFIDYQINSYKGKSSISKLIKEISDIHTKKDFFEQNKKVILSNSQNYSDSLVKALILIDILFVYSDLNVKKIKNIDKLKAIFLELENLRSWTLDYDSNFLVEFFNSDSVRTDNLAFLGELDTNMFIMLGKLIVLEADLHKELYPKGLNRYGTPLDLIYKDLENLKVILNRYPSSV